MKKLLAGFLCMVCLSTSLVGCGSNLSDSSSGQSAEPQKLLYVHGASDTSILQETATYFKKLVEEKTDNRYTIEIHPNFELGSLTESVEMIKAGEVQLSGVILGNYYAPELAIVDLPNAIPNIELANELFTQTEFRDLVADALRKQGIELLDFGAVYFRQTTSNKPIYNADEFKGLNIRTLENSLHQLYWSSIGANPSPLPWAEVYVSLQQGLVDAQENPLDSIVGSKLYEVQDYVINTNHILYTAPVLMSSAFYDSLSPEDQEIFKECGELTEEYIYNYARDMEEDLTQQLKENGMTFIDLPEEELTKLRDMASPVYDAVREEIGDETVDAYLSAIEEAAK